MTRIIAGEAGSLTLKTPGEGTRPTTDRVREAVFSSLESLIDLDGARVLDLYAGSGALGLEAVSRGAARADLVESASGAARSCRENARRVSAAVAPRSVLITVHARTVDAYLAQASGPYDVVFADPPYELPERALRAVHEAVLRALAPGALYIVERSTRTPSQGSDEAPLPDGLRVLRERDYGETRVTFIEAVGRAESAPAQHGPESATG